MLIVIDNQQTLNLTVLFLGLQVIAVILAAFLHQGNGRVISSTSNYNIEKMLDFAEEELNKALNETNEDPSEREENPADVLSLSEQDSSSLEAVHSQFSDDVRGESANKGSDSVILPMEANPVWRHKRSLPDEPECYTGDYKVVHLPNTGLTITYPVCRKVARYTACSSSMLNNNNKRKCVPSNYEGYPKDHVAYPTKCSCAP